MTNTADRDANRALRARFDDVVGQYRRLRSGIDDLQRDLAALRVSATSRDGAVTATVDARGHLVDLKLHRPSSANLDKTILTTVRTATSRATERVAELMSDVLPAESGGLAFMRDGDLRSLLRRSDEIMDRADE